MSGRDKKIGDNLSHPTFGDGILTDFTDTGNLIIEFEEVGRKILSPKVFPTVGIKRSPKLKKYYPASLDKLWLENYDRLVKEIDHSPDGKLRSRVNGKSCGGTSRSSRYS